MNQLIESLKQRFKSGEMHIKLIMVNVAFFVTVLLISIFLKFGNSALYLPSYFSASSELSVLIFRPWTLVTHMFTHPYFPLSHILWNMIILFFGGNLFVSKLGNRKLLSVYLSGGLMGYSFFALGYNFLPAFQEIKVLPLIGASASVLAIFTAIGVYSPNYEIRFPFVSKSVKLIYVVGGYILLNLIWLQSSLGIDGGNSGGWMAHFGGIAFGIFYGSRLKSGKNILSGFESFLDSLFSGSMFSFLKKKKSPKLKVKRGGKSYKQKSNSKQQNAPNKIDIEPILKKVKQSGYSSLTAKEKELFFSQTNNK
ncbi:MAG: rhomboid family intramembrane serine protease [Flavobacteriales bacterium]